MNKEWLEQSIKSLSDESLYKLFQDAELQICFHIPGDDHVPEYIERQQTIARMVKDELKRRKFFAS